VVGGVADGRQQVRGFEVQPFQGLGGLGERRPPQRGGVAGRGEPQHLGVEQPGGLVGAEHVQLQQPPPDLDIEAMEVLAALELSSSAELRLPLRWIAILHRRWGISLAASTGVHTATDVVKGIGQLRGQLSQRSVPDPAAFERANYIKTLASRTPPRR
jgi:hypothetical protein